MLLKSRLLVAPCFLLHLFKKSLSLLFFFFMLVIVVEGSNNKFKFANWKAYDVLNKYSETDIILAEYDLDVCCVSETWLKSSQVWEFPGYIVDMKQIFIHIS